MTTDIDYWGAPESMTADNMPRPAYLVQTADGASDLAGSLVGAFVSSSLAIRQSNSSDATAYADRLLQTATGLYNEVRSLPDPVRSDPVRSSACWTIACLLSFRHSGGSAQACRTCCCLVLHTVKEIASADCLMPLTHDHDDTSCE